MTQTAVEWLNRQIRLNSKIKENSKDAISFTLGLSKFDELFEQAKEMEKEQMRNASCPYIGGWEDDEFEYWYNETYKNKKQ